MAARAPNRPTRTSLSFSPTAAGVCWSISPNSFLSRSAPNSSRRRGFQRRRRALEYLIIDGPTPKQVLDRYTRLTGRPALPPAWSFGLWLTTSFTTDYDEADRQPLRRRHAYARYSAACLSLRLLLDAWIALVRLRVGHGVFPDPEGMLARLNEKGLHICVWINPYIGQRSPLFGEGMDRLSARRPDGGVWQWDQWQPGMGFVDFTNPAAARLVHRASASGCWPWASTASRPISASASRPTSSTTTAPTRRGCTTITPILYNKAVFELLEDVQGEGEARRVRPFGYRGQPTFSRCIGAATASDYESMAESLRGGLRSGSRASASGAMTLAASRARPRPHVYKRWCAFGLLSSHSRLHGITSYRVPWLYDEEAVDVLRFFTKLKCRLMPYLFAAAVEADRAACR